MKNDWKRTARKSAELGLYAGASAALAFASPYIVAALPAVFAAWPPLLAAIAVAGAGPALSAALKGATDWLKHRTQEVAKGDRK
ncbi:MAG TPA: hypothetical protein VEC14_13015 [Reyranellaceae bacterium]|nr:hypothetical protein [Reyranellaceae bacterium]